MVRIFDFANKSITTIPARELAPGMVQARIPGIDGEVWIEARQAISYDSYRHPPFSEKTHQIFRYLRKTFIGVYPGTLEEWEDGFRRDGHPAREISYWIHGAEVFGHFTSGRVLSREKRKDIFAVVLNCMNNGPEYVRMTTNLRTLSSKQVRKIVNYFKSDAAREATRPRRLALCEAFTETGSDGSVIVPIDALVIVSDSNLSLIRDADRIFGVDATTGNEFLVYGLDTSKEIAEGKVGKRCSVLRVRLFQETNDLEHLLTLVQYVKGSHDYQAGAC
jgi:hypothetical protein